MKEWAVIPLRLGLGVMFMAHGLQKIFDPFGGIEGFSKMLSDIGFYPPTFWAYAVAYVELIGGLFLILGLFTRLCSALLLIVMAVAVAKVHLPFGFFIMVGGFEYNFVIMAMCISLIMTGGGKLSITKRL
jgi:putative oxidoreductase